MNFNSDILFKGEQAYVLSLINEHFNVVNESEKDSLKQMNFKVFMLCSYIGLFLDENDMMNLEQTKYKGEETSYTIPRVVLLQNLNAIKELLLCAKFTFNNYKVNDFELQQVWNLENQNDEVEIFNFIKDRAYLGAKYYLGLITNDVLNYEEGEILEDFITRLNKCLEKIDEAFRQKEIEEELLDLQL